MWLRKTRNAQVVAGVAVFPEFIAVGTRFGATVQLRQTLLSTPTRSVDELAGALRLLLSQLPTGAARVKCILSNRLARFGVLPWSSALLAKESAQRYAQDHVAASFGDAAGSLEVRMESAPYGTPRFVCALPRSLRDGLTDAIQASGSTVLSLKPLLSAAIDTSASKISNQTKLVGTVESGVLHYALAQKAQWVQVGSEALSDPNSNDLQIALRRIEIRNPWLSIGNPLVLADGVSEGRSSRLLQLALAS